MQVNKFVRKLSSIIAIFSVFILLNSSFGFAASLRISHTVDSNNKATVTGELSPTGQFQSDAGSNSGGDNGGGSETTSGFGSQAPGPPTSGSYTAAGIVAGAALGAAIGGAVGAVIGAVVGGIISVIFGAPVEDQPIGPVEGEDTLLGGSYEDTLPEGYGEEAFAGSGSSQGDVTGGSLSDTPSGSDTLASGSGTDTLSDDSNSDNGGGSGTVICTELFRQGLLPKSIYEADSLYGKMMDEELMAGYHSWAKPYARLMQKDNFIGKTATGIAYAIGRPWAQEMAYEMGVVEKGSLMGKMVISIGYPINRFIGSQILKQETNETSEDVR